MFSCRTVEDMEEVWWKCRSWIGNMLKSHPRFRVILKWFWVSVTVTAADKSLKSPFQPFKKSFQLHVLSLFVWMTLIRKKMWIRKGTRFFEGCSLSQKGLALCSDSIPIRLFQWSTVIWIATFRKDYILYKPCIEAQ